MRNATINTAAQRNSAVRAYTDSFAQYDESLFNERYLGTGAPDSWPEVVWPQQIQTLPADSGGVHAFLLVYPF